MEWTKLHPSMTAVAAENALSTTIDGETVILHQEIGKYYGLNEVGTFIWEQLQEPRPIEDICRKVVSEYDVERERCRSDVKDLLVDLDEKDLIRLNES